ncbi:hypothetical protein BC830DRAFT_1099132 [Chytriomyces sp. MP71]|nr:hypothetical protein BC830DRAFT_1099132 [Chytriomyces sp. MP71]
MQYALTHRRPRQKNLAAITEFAESLRTSNGIATVTLTHAPPSPNRSQAQRYQNSIAAAMDVPFVPNTRMPLVHPPPRLPPCYEAHLKDIERFREELQDELPTHLQTDISPMVEEVMMLPLKFEPAVEERFANWPHHLGNPTTNVYNKLDPNAPTNHQIGQNMKNGANNLNEVCAEATMKMIHKTSWQRDVTRSSTFPKRKEADSATEQKSIFAAEDGTGWRGGIKMSDSERNVPYMLEVWQRVEGVDINDILNSHNDTAFRRNRNDKHSRRPSSDEGHELGPNVPTVSVTQTDMSPQLKTISRPASGTHTKASRASETSRIVISELQKTPDEMEQKTLSSSTLSLLKRLTQESKGPETLLSKEEVDKVLRMTLTGAGQTTHDVLQTSTVGGAKLEIKRRKRQSYRLKASGGFVINNTQEKDFQLVIPFPDENDGEDYHLNNIQSAGEKREKEKLRGAAGARALVQDLDKSTQQRAAIDLVAISELTNQQPLEKRKSVSVMNEEKIDLTRLITLIKRFKNQESTLLSYDLGENIKIETMEDFLMTPCTVMETMPERGSQAYVILHQTLLLCLLHQESYDLRLEASRFLMQMQETASLPRWEGIAFRNTLSEALTSGNAEESFMAGVCLCNMGLVDSKCVRRVRQGLGDFQVRKREVAIECLANLHVRHASGILDMLLAESSNTSWRVRLDVIELLRVWIQRVNPQEEEEAVVGSVRNLVADSTEAISVMSKQVLGGTSLTDEEDGSSRTGSVANIKEGGAGQTVSTASEADIRMSVATQMANMAQKKLDNQVNRAVEVLLDLMWNDWSKDVRSSATKTLARLGKGKPVFEWIITLLQMEDPAKKIDALKALTGLGVVTRQALPAYLATFKDPYFAVRLEACKVACRIVKAENRILVNTLLHRLDDFDERVRSYAIKAIGLSKCREPRIRESLYWSLIHDPSASVRAEAIHATVELGLLAVDAHLRESVQILMEADRDEDVRREAERVLVEGGFVNEFVKGKPATPGVSGGISSGGGGGALVATGIGAGEAVRMSAVAAVGMDGEAGDEVQGGDDGEERKKKVVPAMTFGATIAAVPGVNLNLPSSNPARINAGAGAASISTRTDSDAPRNSETLASQKAVPSGTKKEAADFLRLPSTVLPNAIKGAPNEDVELYFRDCLVGEAEQRAVIDQVKNMSVASIVLREVEQMERESANLPELGLDLEFRKTTKFEARRRGVPHLRTGIVADYTSRQLGL